jgi:hypothetical protein
MRNKLMITLVGLSALVLAGAGCTTTTKTNSGNETTTNGQNEFEGGSSTTTSTFPSANSTSATSSSSTDQLLSSIRTSTGLNFSTQNSEQISWNLLNPTQVNGQSITIQNISYTDETKIENYLRSQGFQPDTANSSFQGNKIIVAYKKDQMFCRIEGQSLSNIQTNNINDLQNARFNIKVTVGSL